MRSASQPLVSVVTPVYNCAEYLPECIASVLSQTYQNWEYTIVDNLSTDASFQIAQRYAARDSRIRVVQNRQFVPALRNHNLALRQISRTSKYCKVVFADDWIFPECLEKMVGLAEKHPSVGIVSAFGLLGRQIMCAGLPYCRTVVAGREICRQHLVENLHLFGSATTLLYRADLVRSHEPFFNETNIHADTEACFALLRTCDFGFVHQVLTFTRLRPGSLNTVSDSLQTNLAGNLLILRTYGPYYLTEKELDERTAKCLCDYYRFLGRSVFLGRDRKFWNYHKEMLVESGIGINKARLAWAALGCLFSAAWRFQDTIEKLRKAWIKKDPAKHDLN
jgi:glycosyltransferase involved in cell wall biosynthesis